MLKKYKKFISKYISINPITWTLAKSKLKIEHYQKGDVILHMGDVCKKLMFINSGLARSYMIDENGKDHTWVIYFNDSNAHMTNLFVVDYESFVTQKESQLTIDVLEDCEVVSVTYEDLMFLYNKTKKGDRFGRLMSQEAYSYLHNFMIQRQTHSAKERFEAFMKDTPYLLDKVPQYHIATLLGMTPQHLSRLKNEYAR